MVCWKGVDLQGKDHGFPVYHQAGGDLPGPESLVIHDLEGDDMGPVGKGEVGTVADGIHVPGIVPV